MVSLSETTSRSVRGSVRKGKTSFPEIIGKYVERNFPLFLQDLDLESISQRVRRRFEMSRSFRRGIRMSEEEYVERMDLIRELGKAKPSNGSEYDRGRTSIFEPNGEEESSKMEEKGVITPENALIGLPLIEKGSTGSWTLTEIAKDFEKSLEISTEEESYKRGDHERMSNLILEKARKFSDKRVKKIGDQYNDKYEMLITSLEFDGDADEGFDLWLSLIDEFSPDEYGRLIQIEWNGENNLSEDEFASKISRIMVKTGIGPKITRSFDIVETVKEGRKR